MRGRVALVMGLFGVAFIFITFGYIAWEQRNNLLQREEGDIQKNAFFLADHAARLFEVSDLVMQQTMALFDDDAESGAGIKPSRALWRQLSAIKAALPYIDNIWVSDANGQIQLSSLAFPTPAANIADRDAFQAQVQTDRGLFIGKPIFGRVTSQPTFMVSRRLQGQDGSFRGVVTVTLSLSYLDHYWRQLALPRGSRISLMRALDGVILAQYPAPPDGITFETTDRTFFDKAVSAQPDLGSYDDMVGGERRHGAYHRAGALPLYINISLPADAYLTPWIAQTKLYGAFALIALLALLALTALASQQFRDQAANAALLENEVALRTQELRKETAALEILNRTGTGLAGALDINRIVQNVVDAGVELTGARFGAFLHDDTGVSHAGGKVAEYKLYAISGVSHALFKDLPMIRQTDVFAPTFAGLQVVRSDDITMDPRYGQNTPFRGMPPGHPPVRSYMAVPVVSRNGDAQGAILFGHERIGVFTDRAERLVRGLAAQAAITLENGFLYQNAQREIEERKQSQTQQSLLIRELHHRVKNTLATVQAVVGATARSTSSVDDFYEAFVGRIVSLANTHSLLTEALWQTASLRELLEKELLPYNDDTGSRIMLDGPDVELPSEAAVPIGMAVHEMTTNAAKYGALSTSSGKVAVRWISVPDAEGNRLWLEWVESGGPPVTPPTRQGFGSRLLHRVLSAQVNAKVEMDFKAEGLEIRIEAVLKPMPLPLLDPSP